MANAARTAVLPSRRAQAGRDSVMQCSK